MKISSNKIPNSNKMKSICWNVNNSWLECISCTHTPKSWLILWHPPCAPTMQAGFYMKVYRYWRSSGEEANLGQGLFENFFQNCITHSITYRLFTSPLVPFTFLLYLSPKSRHKVCVTLSRLSGVRGKDRASDAYWNSSGCENAFSENNFGPSLRSRYWPAS